MCHERESDSSEPDWIYVSPYSVTDTTMADISRPENSSLDAPPDESVQDRIIRVAADEKDLSGFFSISLSSARYNTLNRFYRDELAALEGLPFERLNSQEDRVDYLLLRNYLRRNRRRLHLEAENYRPVAPFVPFASPLIKLCESRQRGLMAGKTPQAVAQTLQDASEKVKAVGVSVQAGELQSPKMTAFRAIRAVQDLAEHLDDFYSFFKSYNPAFDFWVSDPFAELQGAVNELVGAIRTKLIGTGPTDDIIGDAIGETGLQAELEAEVIPYTPDELIAIANTQYDWCKVEMEKAAGELGFGRDWKAALEHIKGIYEQPGDQPQLIKQLIDEGTAYVKDHDLITVPPVAEQSWRMFMMAPARQRVNPFFLGGPDIIVSYPTADMAHADKLASMRGNATHLSRATAFHEMIPGHHLQGHVAARSRPYRRLFSTPFLVEGWALYWETLLWDRADFFVAPEARVGSLFWRMHRCARILFSLSFHLGRLDPSQCVDLLVDMVGHSRPTAEGEVRRSLAGDYSPLYQAGYMLGALQLRSLRAEALGRGQVAYGEKEFHDRILRANEMPIELLRALLLSKELSRDYKAQWRFGEDNTRNF